LVRSATQVESLHRLYITWGERVPYIQYGGFLRELVEFGFEIMRVKPTTTVGSNPAAEWIENLLEGNGSEGSLKLAAEGLAQMFEGFRLNADAASMYEVGDALDYLGRLVRSAEAVDDPLLDREVLRASFLNRLLNIAVENFEDFSKANENNLISQQSIEFAANLVRVSTNSNYSLSYQQQGLDRTVFLNDLVRLAVSITPSNIAAQEISLLDQWIVNLWQSKNQDINPPASDLIDLKSFADSLFLEQFPITSTDQITLVSTGNVITKVAEKGLRWLASRGKNISGHVINNHIAKNINKTAFSKPNQIKQLTEKVLKKPDRAIDAGEKVIYEKSFDRVVGTNGERIIRVSVWKKTGKIMTSFPAREFFTLSGVSFAISRGKQLEQEIIEARKVHQKATEPNFLERLIDFFNPIDSGGTVYEDIFLLERQMIEDAYQQVLQEAGNVSQEQKDGLLDIMLSQSKFTNW
jgi:hypothetical protein